MSDLSMPPTSPAGHATAGASPGAAKACPNCGREWGMGTSCQFCTQVSGAPIGVRLSSPGKRLGAYLVEGVLMVVTLGLGWLIWSLIVWAKGTTPAKSYWECDSSPCDRAVEQHGERCFFVRSSQSS